MKRLAVFITLVFVTFSFTQAQDNKPTKEQTIQFIKSHFEGKSFYVQPCEEKDILKSASEGNFSIEFDERNCTITISWDYLKRDLLNGQNREITFSYKVIMDFSKVESVTLYPMKRFKCDGGWIYANFKASPGNKITFYDKSPFGQKEFKMEKRDDVSIPINAYTCDNCDHYAVNKKILQAFNHLRKLCGAPEPVNFD